MQWVLSMCGDGVSRPWNSKTCPICWELRLRRSILKFYIKV